MENYNSKRSSFREAGQALVFCRKGEVKLAQQFFLAHGYSDGDYYAAFKIYLDCQIMLKSEPQEVLNRVVYDEKQGMLARIAERANHPDVFLALGDIYYENSEFDLCFDAYEAAALLGNYSGYFCAAKVAEIIKDNKELSRYVTHPRDPVSLYQRAAACGHLFAKGRMLYLEREKGTHLKLRYQLYRFFIRPMLALRYLASDRAHENCVPWN